MVEEMGYETLDRGDREMKVIAKKGFEMDIDVSGFTGKFDSEIRVSFDFGGKVVKNERAVIVRDGKIKEGVSLPRLNGMVECEVSAIEKAISELPVKVKMYAKKEKSIDADGDIVKVQAWYRDGFEVDSQYMSDFLNSLGVSEISVEEADAKYEEYQTSKSKPKKAEKIDAGFMDDMMEEGFEQACENAGVSRFVTMDSTGTVEMNPTDFYNKMKDYDRFYGSEVTAVTEGIVKVSISDDTNDDEYIIRSLHDLAIITGDVDVDHLPDDDSPLIVDHHGIETWERVRLYYGDEYFEALKITERNAERRRLVVASPDELQYKGGFNEKG